MKEKSRNNADKYKFYFLNGFLKDMKVNRHKEVFRTKKTNVPKSSLLAQKVVLDGGVYVW